MKEPVPIKVELAIQENMIADFEAIYPGARSDLAAVVYALLRIGCSLIERAGPNGRARLARSIENFHKMVK